MVLFDRRDRSIPVAWRVRMRFVDVPGSLFFTSCTPEFVIRINGIFLK